MKTERTGHAPDNAQAQQEDRRPRPARTALAVLATVLLVAAAVIAINTLNDGPDAAGTAASVACSATTVARLPDGRLDPGRYVFGSSFEFTVDSGLGDHQITLDVPDGYEGVFGTAALKSGMEQTGVSTLAVGDIYADACQWQGALVDGISSTDDIVGALASQEGLRVSHPTDVTVDGLPATYLERTVPAHTRPSDCDGGEIRVYLDRDGGNRFLNPGQLDLLWIVDIDGVPLVIDASMEHGSSAATRAELERMVESIHIDHSE